MSVYSLVMGGLTPVGALVSGGLAEVWGAGGAFAVGGTAALACTLGVLRWRPAAGPAPARASPAGGSIGSTAQGRKHAPPGAR